MKAGSFENVSAISGERQEMRETETGCKLRATLRQHLLVRMVVLVSLVALALGTCELLEIHIPLAPVVVIALLMAAVSAAAYVRLRRAERIGEAEIFGHILLDVAALTALLYFTGGVYNPFAYCYLLLVLYGATALPQRFGWALAAASVLCFSLLQVFYVPLPLPDTLAAHAGLDEMARWVVYVMLAGLVLWFALRLNELRRSHYRHIEAEAEERARERYLLGLATLAAGTAHEMGTPLSTMSVVVGDLRRSGQPPADWKEQIDLLWRQLLLCKHSLSGLARASDLAQLGKTHVVPARAFIEGLAKRFHLLRPEVPLSLHYAPDDNALALRVDLSLEQALLSLLNNAAQASPEAVDLRVSAEGAMLEIDILDRGPGISPQLRERLGRGPVGARPGGHGLGLLIANSAIERLGGSVLLRDREGGGTCARVELPLHAAAPAAPAAPAPGRDYNKGASVAAA